MAKYPYKTENGSQEHPAYLEPKLQGCSYPGFPDSSVGKVRLQSRRPWLDSWGGKICWRRDSYPLQYSWASLVTLLVKTLPAAGDLGLTPRLGRFPGGGHGNPLQYSCLENPHGQRSLAGYSHQDFNEASVQDEKYPSMGAKYPSFTLGDSC